ncbi:MAG: hypothetical protein BWX88_01982 [Planctomycetes bacterium ADurb.Bin126]|nr:MAG: hypothetical protein BWX88_01982 [Planctomycetes bacterium ADurb.Bin126]
MNAVRFLARVVAVLIVAVAPQAMAGPEQQTRRPAGQAGQIGWDGSLPGPAPGEAAVRCEGDRLAAGTAALTLEWKATNGLRLSSIRTPRTVQPLATAGELFAVVLADGRRYAASQLVAQGAPRRSDRAADPRCPRLAGRLPAKRVELDLRSADGLLRVAWRAEVMDQSNYVRQEIVLTPSADCVIREVVWLEGVIPSARGAGSVDGTPLVAGELFFGCEDPHALNEVETSREAVGRWAPTDLKYKQRNVRIWPIEGKRLRPGENEILFVYDRGPHRLDVWRVELRQGDKVVAHDEHHGWTGSSHADNVYRLTLPALDKDVKYELAAELSTDPEFTLPPGQQQVVSHGTVYVAGPGGRVACRLPRSATLGKDQTLTVSLVIGAAAPAQMRRSFLYYLERERAHPYRPFLHYNSWYDTAWKPFALNEANCLEAIRECGQKLVRRHGVVLDALVFDDGWDDPKTLWQFHKGFPKGFAPLAELCKAYDTRLGVWLSPFGGYGEPKKQRQAFGREQGYETNAAGFSMAGPKYYQAFKRSCVEMIRRYGVNHFKFDGIASGMSASGPGSGFLLDTEAMRRLMLELRGEDPTLYVNLTTGSWPSPWWLRYADSIWRQGGDMGRSGKGSRQQQWLTYRDQEVYRNIVRRSPLYPLNALMTQGVAYSRQGMAGDPTFTSAGFRDDVRAFFGAGTSLQELYIQPGRLTDADWAVLAEAARWARTNADVLVDTHWVAGDPGKLEPYGYASWSPRKGILMIRNPDDCPREFTLDLEAALELPAGATRRFDLKSPWVEDKDKPTTPAEAGTPLRIMLHPFEVRVLEALPRP